MNELEGRAIVVTGAFGVLGAAVVRAVLASGARAAAIDHAEHPHGDSDLGDCTRIGGIDLADVASAKSAMQRAADALGGFDGLVNIAGAFQWETIAEGSLDTWDTLYRINVRTAAAASQAAIPHLFARGGGRIVNIGAAAAAKAANGMGAYAASKAGVARLTEALADELKDKNIAVNAVLPSIIDTARNREDMPTADFSRWVQPTQLADVIVFLLSSKASAITGALIPVTGRV